MNVKRDYQFYVVEILKKQTIIDKYCCIPSSWISFRDVHTQRAAIKYPAENVSDTNWRVENKKSYLYEWPIHNVHVIYGTDAYQDAQDYTKILNERNMPITQDDESSNEKRIYNTEFIQSIPGNLNKVNLIESSKKRKPTECYLETNTSKKLKISNKDKETYIDSNTPINKKLSSNYVNEIIQKKIKENQSPDSDKKTLISISGNEIKLPVFQPKSENQLNTIITSKSMFSAGLSDISDVLKIMDVYFKENQMLIQKLDVVLTENRTSIKKIMVLLDKYCNFINENKKEIEKEQLNKEENMDKEQVEVEDEEEKKASEEEQKQENIEDEEQEETDTEEQEDIEDNEQEETEAEEQESEDSEQESDDSEQESEDSKQEETDEEELEDVENQEHEEAEGEVPLDPDDEEYENEDEQEDEEECKENSNVTARGQPQDFSLPPEYDENDSRWTLKYKRKRNNLVELMPYSNIYVHRNGLIKCQQLSSDAKGLSRHLLGEIFTESAMRTCSVTGKKANAFKGNKLRPGLDKHAVTVLMNYVHQYSKRKHWDSIDTHGLMSTLRNKLQDTRAKYKRQHCRRIK